MSEAWASKEISGAAVKSELARRASSFARASESRREVVWSMGEEGVCVEENGRRDWECCGSGCDRRVVLRHVEPVDGFGRKARAVPRNEQVALVLEAMMCV